MFLILYGLNQFFNFLPTSYGKMPENTQAFLDAIVAYLPAVYILEIIIGLFLLFNKWVGFILIVLFPLSISFLIFNLSHSDFNFLWTAILVAGLNIILMILEKDKFKPLFK